MFRKQFIGGKLSIHLKLQGETSEKLEITKWFGG
jgi:hypothetical protein